METRCELIQVKKKAIGGSSETNEGFKGEKVQFHMSSIPRPQELYNISANNLNQPFKHVWLERSEDGSRFVHPMEKLSVLDFVDSNTIEIAPIHLPSVESTPFTLVEGVRALEELTGKLKDVNEFAVDLEHNQYRSFQGLTCLMQISTRTEDFVIDTFKLHFQIGLYLREVFRDPSKRKVMHGADNDILWLQRDFGIYVCNLFDTGQASRVMKLERNSLEYLLDHFCGIKPNKEYQNVDWRLRPLPNEMLKYAREDTHNLLYMYDLMKRELLLMSTDGNREAFLVEVYKRSNEICMKLYEKPLVTKLSYLHIYGLHGADFNAQQLFIVSGLYEWRDGIARENDESTGYVLPNKALLEIARQMPLSCGKLLNLVKSKFPYVNRYLQSIIDIIRSSIQSASSVENVVVLLQKSRQQAAIVEQNKAVGYISGCQEVDVNASLNTLDGCVKPEDNREFSSRIVETEKCSKERLRRLPFPEIGYFFMKKRNEEIKIN